MNIRDAVRELARSGQETVAKICKVDRVYENRTIDCTPIDEGAPLLGVNLQANQGSDFGVVVIPKEGSYVVVGFVAEGSAGVVLLTDDIERVEAVIEKDTARAVMDKEGVRINVGESISVELTKDCVTFNGGDLGGLVKVEDLTGRINTIEKDINALKNVFSGWTPSPQDGGAALKGAVSPWAGQTLTLTQRGDYENEKVKQ